MSNVSGHVSNDLSCHILCTHFDKFEQVGALCFALADEVLKRTHHHTRGSCEPDVGCTADQRGW